MIWLHNNYWIRLIFFTLKIMYYCSREQMSPSLCQGRAAKQSDSEDTRADPPLMLLTLMGSKAARRVITGRHLHSDQVTLKKLSRVVQGCKHC